MNDPDLSLPERIAIRTALRYLRARCGTWEQTSKLLRFKPRTLCLVAGGKKTATVTMALRIAKAAKVTVDDVLGGRFPGHRACPHCGLPVDEPVPEVADTNGKGASASA
jgi:hypothetical protein